MDRDVVVTGLGAVTSVGTTLQSTWEAVCNGDSGVETVSRFDPGAYELQSHLACSVPADPTTHELVTARKMGRHEQYAVLAAEEALEDAALDPEGPAWDAEAVGTSVASALAGLGELEAAATSDGRPSTRLMLQYLSNMAAGYVSIAFDARGPNRAQSSACAAGTHAIADAAADVQRGRADVVIAGGAEGAVSPLGLQAFDAMRALSTRNEDPEGASRPFDADRDGFVVGEGAGVLILEAREHARERGMTPYAEVTGAGFTGDAHHPTRPPEDAAGLRRCIQAALDDAGRDPTAVEHVNAHGTSTPKGDAHEATALTQVFEDVPPVTSTKSQLGHTLGAAGAIEGALVAQTITTGRLPPTSNYETPDPACDLPVVTEPAKADPDVVLSTSAGFGGTNGALVFESATHQ